MDQRDGLSIHLGELVRAARLRAGRSQKELAAAAGISASYLNLLEHGRRALPATLLPRLAEALGVPLAELLPTPDPVLATRLLEALGSAPADGEGLEPERVRSLAQAQPELARAVVRLADAYARARESAETLAARLSERLDVGDLDAAPLPSDAVSNLLQRHQNHFPELEAAAERLWREAGLAAGDLERGLVRHLEARHGVRVGVVPPAALGRHVRRFVPASKDLLLSESLPAASRVFQLGHQLGLLEEAAALDRMTEAGLETPPARALGRVALANYFAAAVLMPYEPFLAAAEAERYDLELLENRFAANVEQVAHRLTTLRRPGREGVPFHFVRVDLAGNVSKRFSATGLHLGRIGSCARWAVHNAFLTPGRILVQVEEMPDGAAYLSIARTVTREARGFRVPRVVQAITLGCRLRDAPALVYAEGLDLERGRVPIGPTCRLCDRLDCEQRATPSLRHPLRIDVNARGVSFYAPP